MTTPETHRPNRIALASLLKWVCVAVVLALFTASPASVSACPMCKIAHEDATDPAVQARPRAYMYSIFFMLAMPAGLVTLFGVTFYRLSKKQQELNAILLSQADEQGLSGRVE